MSDLRLLSVNKKKSQESMAASVAGPPSVAEALHSWYVYQLLFCIYLILDK